MRRLGKVRAFAYMDERRSYSFKGEVCTLRYFSIKVVTRAPHVRPVNLRKDTCAMGQHAANDDAKITLLTESVTDASKIALGQVQSATLYSTGLSKIYSKHLIFAFHLSACLG